jgi:hypothetical protein
MADKRNNFGVVRTARDEKKRERDERAKAQPASLTQNLGKILKQALAS